jgi:hypothetical protein
VRRIFFCNYQPGKLKRQENKKTGEDLNVIFYQNMPNLHNRYKLAERKISQKNPKYNCPLLL